MARVLETLTLPRASAVPATSRNFVNLQASRGLRIQSFGSPKLGRKLSARIVCQAQEAVQVLAVTDATWQKNVMESEVPVLVEFWAPWCGPCRMIHPIIDELAKEYTGKLACYKVNTDESPTIASKYGIRSIPTVIIFKDGEKKDAVIGAVPKSTLCTSIEKFL